MHGNYVVSSYSFQDLDPQGVKVEIKKYLADLKQVVDDFAEEESFARHILEAAEKNDNETLRAVDRTKFSRWSHAFSQSRDWFWKLQKIIPHLVLEITQHQPSPKTMKVMQKAYTFCAKPWKWNPKGLDPYAEIPAKYLAVLKDLRAFLSAFQEAASRIGDSKARSISVGQFELFDSLGVDEATMERVVQTLKEAESRMKQIGLGEYCYGKVTIVKSSNFERGSAAFYNSNTDEVYVTPDLGGGYDLIALCHELGHRVYFKLSLRHQAEELYQSVRERGIWVTNYAKTNANENFAEMVAYAAVGKLTDEAKPLLQSVTRQIRVATRYLSSNPTRIPHAR